MSVLARVVLLATAALCGAFVALLGSYTTGTSLFWFVAAAFVASPLWVPASIPNRYRLVQMICRWFGAAALLIPIFMFGSIVVHNVTRSLSGLGASPDALAQGTVLTLLCLACVSILLWPEVRRHVKRAA